MFSARLKSLLNDFNLQNPLNNFNFPQLFNELGWGQPTLDSKIIVIGKRTFALTPIAHKRSVPVFLCSPDVTGKIPKRPTLQNIGKEVTKTTNDYLLISADKDETMLTLLWGSRSVEPPATVITGIYTWHKGKNSNVLLYILLRISWLVEEEGTVY
jgi:hypothetical protein